MAAQDTEQLDVVRFSTLIAQSVDEFKRRLDAACAEGPREPVPMVPATLPDMIAAEPRLAALLERAREVGKQDPGNWHNYSDFKRELNFLIGWEAEREEVSDSGHWMVVIEALTEALEV